MHNLLSWATISWILINAIYCQNETDEEFPTPPLFSNEFNEHDDDIEVNNNNNNNTAGSLNSTTTLTSTTFEPSTTTTTTTTTTMSTLMTTMSTPMTMSSDLPRLTFEPFGQFRQANLNRNFTQKSPSEDRGMWMLYEITDWFLNRVQPNDFPDYLLTDDDLKSYNNLFLSLKQNHKQWIKYQQGFIITAGICLLMTLVFTVCYVFYICCCRCFCKETSEKLRDKRHDGCRRHCCNGILACLVLAMMFSIVCAFISNHFVHIAVTNMPKNLRFTADDMTMYKDETSQRFKKLLVDDFRSLNRTFSTALNSASSVMVERIKQTTGGSALDRLATISDKADKFVKNLNSIENSLPALDGQLSQFKNNLTKIRQWASDELYKCLNSDDTAEKNDCETVIHMVGYSKSVPEKLSSISNQFNHVKEQLSKIAVYQLSSKLNTAQMQFEELMKKIDDNVGNNKKLITDQMNEFGKNLETASANISRELLEIDISSAKVYIDEYENDLLSYEFYRWIGGFIVSGILALLILCLGFGLIFGVCGRRPGFYEDDCCVWTRGGRLYCGAVILGVLFSLLFMVGTIFLFFIGGNGQTIFCRSMQVPNEPSGFLNIVQRLVDIMKTTTDLRRDSVIHEILQDNNKLSVIINGCSENKTLYNIFSFDNHYRLFNLKDSKPEVYRQLNSYFEQQSKNFNVKMNFDEFINTDVESKLNVIHKISIPPIPSKLIDEFKKNSSMFDFDEKLIQLKDLMKSNNIELQNFIRILIPSIDSLRKDLANSINRNFLFIYNNLSSINALSANLTKDIPSLVLSVKNAQGLLNNNLPNYLQNASKHLIKDVQSYFDLYFDRMKKQLDTEVTSCEPIQQTLTTAIEFICDDTLHPFNGFWACIAICLILSVPSIILASALRDLYANTDPYVGGESYPMISANDRSERVNAFLMTDGYSPVANGTATSKKSSARNQANASAWRTPANSMYFDDSNRPPPPYRSPPGRHK